MIAAARRTLAIVGLALAGASCDEPVARLPPPTSSAPEVMVAAATADAEPTLEAAAEPARVALGGELVVKHECNRCHSIAGIAAPAAELDCVGCHLQIVAGTLPVPADELARYQHNVKSLVEVPKLVPGDHFRRAWLERFLADTHDLRPNLTPTMPRLALASEDVAAIAAFLAPAFESAATLGDATRGRAVVEAKSCGTCHRLGAEALPAPGLAVQLDAQTLALGQRLAPDLVHARDRLRPAALLRWLADPPAERPGTPMPKIAMTEQELADVAAWLLQTPVTAAAPTPMPERLPVLARTVSYEEVDARIFHKTCRHCHSNPEQVIGDGGPGYSGGFGFRKRGLDLNSYEGVSSGSIDDAGARRSLFQKLPDGTPRIVAQLWARHAELAGKPVEGVRGMPLALPPLPVQDIQLLETWIAQGRKRGAAAEG
jgi:cytochrome c2